MAKDGREKRGFEPGKVRDVEEICHLPITKKQTEQHTPKVVETHSKGTEFLDSGCTTHMCKDGKKFG